MRYEGGGRKSPIQSAQRPSLVTCSGNKQGDKAETGNPPEAGRPGNGEQGTGEEKTAKRQTGADGRDSGATKLPKWQVGPKGWNVTATASGGGYGAAAPPFPAVQP
jgi:hypothetical protein